LSYYEDVKEIQQRRETMTKKEMKEAVREMKEAGAEMMKERNGEFFFGEWAGESETEIIESVTGLDMDDLSPEDVDELCDAFLGL
jgi:TRAP-type C4-dicarboxylate transport system substrate-binding protein